uniref:Uncharacterized protein n=1 Tax=Anopheles atroparvus TaxID=41427 RepID=A0AAG5DEC2_ANOAO
MGQRKKKQPGSCPPPLRYEWTKAYPARPKDNLTVHQDGLAKRPFRPSYEMEGESKMDSLMDWSYGRQWHAEVTVFRAEQKSAAAEKRPKKKIPVYPSARPCTGCTNPVQFTMKKFQNVPAKVDTRGTLRATKSDFF